MEDMQATVGSQQVGPGLHQSDAASPNGNVGGGHGGGCIKSPLFTIEQIELIRRLRNSGITKDQVVQAFEELERMDVELGRQFNVPVAGTSPSACTVAAAGSTTSSPSSSGGGGGGGGVQSSAAAAAQAANLMNPFTYLQLQQHLLRQLTVAAQLNNHGENSLDCGIARSPSQSSESPPSTPQAAVQHMSGGYLLNPRVANGHHEAFIEDQVELQDFMKQNDGAILEEIRKFVMRYNIKQHFIAEMAKISQAYVSRYFRGEVAEMSERTKIAIYSWYLTCKKNPWKLKQICPNSGVKRMVSDSGDLIPLKRERFTFKSAHLAILEKYYNIDPYPDSQTREQIVEECNRAMAKPDRELTEREKVTINVVTNWFNNRRKEAKQKLRQQAGLQTLDLSQGLGVGAPSWDQMPIINTPAQIVCQPDIEPSESDQSQDELVDAMKVSTSVSLEDCGLLDIKDVIKDDPDTIDLKLLLMNCVYEHCQRLYGTMFRHSNSKVKDGLQMIKAR